ncbi:MAG: hypothetical protein ACTSR0_04190 [Candidatus Asgardarchaeia archaeon]
MSEIWEIDKELIKRRKNPFDLSEFDTWVNVATIRDLKRLIKEQDVIGLKIWEFKIVKREELKNYICNFGIDLIFKAEDEEKVKEIIKQYHENERKDWYKATMDYIDELFDLAVYICVWV